MQTGIVLSILLGGLFSTSPNIGIVASTDYCSNCFSNTAQSAPLGAIVQLQGLDLSPPQTRGEAWVDLGILPGSQVFVLNLQVGSASGEFLLDTGASTTLVSPALVQELKLSGKPVPGDRLTSAVAGEDCPDMGAVVHQLPTLSLDQLQIEALSALEFSSTLIPEGLAGVLGMDALRYFDLSLNPQTQELEILSPRPLSAIALDQGVSLQSRLGVLLAQVKINGQGPFTFLLDTGADTIFISPQLADQLQLDPETLRPIQVQGFCGLEQAQQSTLNQVELYSKVDTYQQTNLEVVILSSPSVLDLLKIDGILGQSFLNAYEQYWHFILEPNPGSGSGANSQEFRGSLFLNTPDTFVREL
ncbi:MAG: clan AA aspartic protease [Oscillatoriales cyanobacterium RM2_1_1]|nr:clan AA aspartic protease [Oscillatoriales cyanobacterium SM2_3_0]NJO45129.1 clan AA aspartic protease [Oscillatoriales cyanobacterium RM2_1_1]